MAGTRRLCLYMPYLPTDRARRSLSPAAAVESRALVLTRTVGASVVVACVDERARALGLRAGISLGQAQGHRPRVAVPAA